LVRTIFIIFSFYFMRRFYRKQLVNFLATVFAAAPLLAAAAPFTPGNIVVARVGDGSAALTSASTEVFLDEYTPSGTLVQSVPLPTAVDNNNRALTAAGNALGELGLTRSADGHYLVLAGYGVSPGTSAVASSTATDVTRVIGLIGADGSVDTSTSAGEAFGGAGIWAAATADGSSFYSVGSAGGVQYQTRGAYGSTQVSAAPGAGSSINVVGGKVYVASSFGPYVGLSQVGTGLPTTTGQATVALPGFPGATEGASPYGFFLADLDATVPGVDVAYVADDNAPGGGIQKWSLVNNRWVLNGTIAGTASAAVRGLNGQASGTAVSLVAASRGGLYFLTDNAGYNAAPTLARLPAAVATADANTAFRGVAFAPVAPAPAIAGLAPASGPVGTTVTVKGSSFTGATALTLNGAAVPAFTVVDAATITFVVPAGAASGLVSVATPSGQGTSTTAFTVVAPAPTIASFTPTMGSAGTVVTITGTNLTGATAVSIGTTSIAGYTVVSANSITFAVPSGTTTLSGPITVVTPGGTATSAASFSMVVLANVAAQALPELSIYPNPATDYVQLEMPQATALTVGVRDLLGRQVLAPVVLQAHQPLRLPASLAAGVYLLDIEQGATKAVRRIEKK